MKRLARCAGVLLTGYMVCAAAGGAAAAETARVYPPLLRVDGQRVLLLNAQKEQLPLLQYQNSNYFPVRTAGEWMGKTVSWNDSTRTVSLFGTAERTYYNAEKYGSRAYGYPVQSGAIAAISPASDIQIVIDGQARTFINARGETVAPIVCRDTVYLPLRNIGELLGMRLAWTDASATQAPRVSLYSAMTAAQSAACKQYLDTMRTKAQALQRTAEQLLASGLSGSSFDRAAAKQLLERMETQLAALHAETKPDVPYLATSTDALYTRLDVLSAKLKEAYAVVDTQSKEALFAIGSGSTPTGALRALCTLSASTPIVEIEALRADFSSQGMKQ
ncbi:MAG: copper amine oxidase N-terminal domain-containing protein [Clostridia bacterium]|nr:copper amine oxidase N-terminal domain-containing protein [Clostridia bacterium]